MLYLAAVCLLSAIIAAVVGFALLGNGQTTVARVFFSVFLLLCVVAALAGVWHRG
jgi:uncharacterized membrane protein YtjA (UPF0391 family)